MPSSPAPRWRGSANSLMIPNLRLLDWRFLNQLLIDILLKGGRAMAWLHDYSQEHPYLFALQLLGITTFIGACALLPILGAVGFSAMGPVAGSAAASWQASIGLVEAGTLFAWCQSAAMGGYAMSAIIATGTVGGVTAIVPGAYLAASQKMDDMGQRFKQKLRAMWPW